MGHQQYTALRSPEIPPLLGEYFSAHSARDNFYSILFFYYNVYNIFKLASGKIWVWMVFWFFLVVSYAFALIAVYPKERALFKLWVKQSWYQFISDITTVILYLSLIFTVAFMFLFSSYASILAIISTMVGVLVGIIFYARSLRENYVVKIIGGGLSFLGSIAIIPLSRTLAGADIERKTALSAEYFGATWDVISLFYAFPLIFALTSMIFLVAYLIVVPLVIVGKVNYRLVLFTMLIWLLSLFMLLYPLRPLSLYLDDIIASTFVQNCQITSEGKVQNCICKDFRKKARIHFYEGNNVVEAKLRSESFPSSEDATDKYDFNLMGDGEKLGCVGVSVEPT